MPIIITKSNKDKTKLINWGARGYSNPQWNERQERYMSQKDNAWKVWDPRDLQWVVMETYDNDKCPCDITSYASCFYDADKLG